MSWKAFTGGLLQRQGQAMHNRAIEEAEEKKRLNLERVRKENLLEEIKLKKEAAREGADYSHKLATERDNTNFSRGFSDMVEKGTGRKLTRKEADSGTFDMTSSSQWAKESKDDPVQEALSKVKKGLDAGHLSQEEATRIRKGIYGLKEKDDKEGLLSGGWKSKKEWSDAVNDYAKMVVQQDPDKSPMDATREAVSIFGNWGGESDGVPARPLPVKTIQEKAAELASIPESQAEAFLKKAETKVGEENVAAIRQAIENIKKEDAYQQDVSSMKKNAEQDLKRARNEEYRRDKGELDSFLNKKREPLWNRLTGASGN